MTEEETQHMKVKMLFIGDIPMLMPEHSVARQFQIEMWLGMSQLYKELGLKSPSQEADERRKQYVS